jgi:hypothetical protein
VTDEGFAALWDATRVQKLADGPDRDLGAIARELRRTQALVAALDDRLGE